MCHKINVVGHDQYFFFLMKKIRLYHSAPKGLFQIYRYTQHSNINFRKKKKKTLKAINSMAHIQEFLEGSGFQTFWNLNHSSKKYI